MPESPISPTGLKQLEEVYKELNDASDSQAMRMSNRHLYDDARVAVSQAAGCRIGPTMRAFLLMGHTLNYHNEDVRRYVEDEKARERIYQAAVHIQQLAEDLALEALTSTCMCKNSQDPAPLLGE